MNIVFCPFLLSKSLSKVKILFSQNNLGYFDRPWSYGGVKKVTYLLQLGKLGVLVMAEAATTELFYKKRYS